MTKVIIGFSLAVLALSVSTVLAQADRSAMELATSGTERVLNLPASAATSPVISLGPAIDQASGQLVEGYAIVHYKDQGAKPADSPAKGGKGEQTTCYGFLAKDTKWKLVEPWVVNPANLRGLAATDIFDILTNSVNKWENAATADILGVGSATAVSLTADTISPDGANEVYFADIAEDGAIGVTIVWGIFGGPPSQRQLVEWDQVYDDTDFDWSTTGAVDKMDFDNIATHELGHSVGLGDLYNSGCAEETMYGYATEGETKKRTLENGDITGISKLYRN